MNTFSKKLIAVVALALAAGTISAGEKKPSGEKAIDYRESVMTIYKWNIGPIGAMAAGKRAYDATAFEKHARDLIGAGRLDMLAGFPEGSESEESSAMSDVWLDWEGFTGKYDDFQKALDGLEKSLASDDKAARMAAVGGVGKSCKGCHKAYKE